MAGYKINSDYDTRISKPMDENGNHIPITKQIWLEHCYHWLGDMEPAVATIDPPSPGPLPAVMVITPPAAIPAVPTVMEMEPPLPLVAVPVPMRNSPLLAFFLSLVDFALCFQTLICL